MRVLIADDDPVAARVLQHTLQQLGHTVTMARDGEDAMGLLVEGQFRIVISDWLMPRVDGLELCRRIRARSDCAYVYIILLTSRTDKENRLLALSAGADDFLAKPVDRAELVARLNGASRILCAQEELQRRSVELEESQLELARRNAQLSELATMDSLTGLKNHGYVREALQRAVARDLREGGPLSLLMLDVDRFKLYNDSFGHPAGDEVLQRLATLLKGAVREYDLAARYGGEEFAMVLEGADKCTALSVAERVRLSVECESWPHRPITVSIGAATLGLQCLDAATLIEHADQALYAAKLDGRNCAVHCSDVFAVPGPQNASAR